MYFISHRWNEHFCSYKQQTKTFSHNTGKSQRWSSKKNAINWVLVFALQHYPSLFLREPISLIMMFDPLSTLSVNICILLMLIFQVIFFMHPRMHIPSLTCLLCILWAQKYMHIKLGPTQLRGSYRSFSPPHYFILMSAKWTMKIYIYSLRKYVISAECISSYLLY